MSRPPEPAADTSYAYTITSRTRVPSLPSSSAVMGHPDARKGAGSEGPRGVVGQQPLLRPQEKHEYTSGTAIATPVGTMRGSYQMAAEDGVAFEAPIPEFTLTVPRVLH